MKQDSLYSYVGKKFIDDKINRLNSPISNKKCNQFIRRIDSVFIELDKIENIEKRAYIALAIKKQFTYELYNDLKINIPSKIFFKSITSIEILKRNMEQSIKDEIFGYLNLKQIIILINNMRKM